ncbi:MAG: glycoside hydrolase [Ignavibacteriales bacterium]|nr:glycoside hydrolase [Ignavibacteriales bacterium]
MIGPHRGGRTVGVGGIASQPNVFFVGVNNGGVWKTSDYGRTWKPIFDDQPTGSIGALAVAPSNPNIIYVGSGEGLQRPDLSVGDGMFKSTDGGTTWSHLGLSDAQQIGAVLVDPKNPDRLFVAVLGHPYGVNKERGVFRSLDGGQTWKNVLYKDENTGAVGLAFDPTNAQTVYATLWSSRQGPWENGAWQGRTSGLFKSVDGGETWRQLANGPARHQSGGLPTADDGLGRIGIGIAPNDPKRVYALVDAREKAGLYRSDDAGETWQRISSDWRVIGRGSDFAEVKVHPFNHDVVFVANTCTYKSTDGGATFVAWRGAPGGDDYHTIWINPMNPDVMLLAADQGVIITVNGGETWSSWYNQPTAQFYHVVTDNEFPYNVYGGQQESGSVGIVSRGNDGRITFREWHPVGADEYAYIAPDPLHPNIIYGGKMSKYDKSTGQVQFVGPEVLRSGQYRFLRTMPLVFSPADKKSLFLASNVLFKTMDGGANWEIVSPDLSREKPDVPASIGIFRTAEVENMQRRGVIYSVAPSPLDVNIIWAGTDDGLVHTTIDGGKSWKNITPSDLTAWSKVSQIDAGHFDRQTAYAAVNRIRLDDQRPYIYKTHDGGKTWEKIVGGLPENGPVNTVREDPNQAGILYAGTERAVYVSLDDGESWQSLRNNMPATSIRDLVVHDDDIVVGTHGRSFWILDNVSSLRQLKQAADAKDAFLFQPREAVRVRWNQNTDTPLPPEEPSGENPPDGATIDYVLKYDAKNVRLEILDEHNQPVRVFTSADQPEEIREANLPYPNYWFRPFQKLDSRAGMHRFVWNLRYAPPKGFSRSFPIAATARNTASIPPGPWVAPAKYTIKLVVDGITRESILKVLIDPRVKSSAQDIAEQNRYSLMCYDKLSELHEMLESVRGMKKKTTDKNVMKQLDDVAGPGAEGDIDVTYSSVRMTPKESETISSLQSKYLYVMSVMQNADVAPSPQAQKAVVQLDEVYATVRARWQKLAGAGK